MQSPTLRPPVIKRRDEGFVSVIRWGLLVWAILRLVVSVLLTAAYLYGAILTIRILQHEYELQEKTEALTYLWLLFVILVQLVEFGMLATFVVAGFTKSARLYRDYYRYCILTLVIYIISVILCIILVHYEYVYKYMDIYLTYQIAVRMHIFGDFTSNFSLFLVAVSDVVLEILLIVSIKKLIQTYSFRPVNVVIQ